MRLAVVRARVTFKARVDTRKEGNNEARMIETNCIIMISYRSNDWSFEISTQFSSFTPVEPPVLLERPRTPIPSPRKSRLSPYKIVAQTNIIENILLCRN